MTPFSPSATAILADLQFLGVDLKPPSDVIRYRPRQAMTPTLLVKEQSSSVNCTGYRLAP
jgi:hypothetical protein